MVRACAHPHDTSCSTSMRCACGCPACCDATRLGRASPRGDSRRATSPPRPLGSLPERTEVRTLARHVSCLLVQSILLLSLSRRVLDAPDADGRGALVAVGEEKVLVVRPQLDLVGEVPAGARGAVVGAAAQQHGARVLVLELVRVLPHVAHEVAHAKGRVPRGGVRANRLRPAVGGAGGQVGEVGGVLGGAPRVRPPIKPLRRVLPLVRVRQPRAARAPAAVRARVRERDVGHRRIRDRRRRFGGAVPVGEPVRGVGWLVARRAQVRGVVGIGRGELVHVERGQRHGARVLALRVVLPRELHVDPVRIVPFNLDALGDETEVGRRGHRHHACGRSLCARRGGDGHGALLEEAPLGRERRERLLGHLRHRLQEGFETVTWLATDAEHAAIPVRLKVEREH
mmetsp:Transcript_33353/g.87888  ORF Transcript_33353/g.87888 Transcript_33353/m.87888 type:complete len:400 (+) Transcript_33353:57-1256(+)